MTDTTQTPKGTQPETGTDQNPEKQIQEIDYKTKFSESTRQNQVLQGQLSRLNQQLGEFINENPPTDEEMQREMPEYAFADEATKVLMKRQVMAERKTNRVFSAVESFTHEAKQMQELQKRIAEDPRFAGREIAFIEWATHPSRSGTPVDVLISAYLFEVPSPSKQEEPASPVHTLERGNPSGGIPPSTPGKMSDEDLADLRKNRPTEYMERIRKGQL